VTTTETMTVAEYPQAQPTFPGMGMSLAEKVDLAIRTLQTYEDAALRDDPENGYYLCFSGGKDSIVIKRLAQLAGVRFVSHYSVTTLDPPELIRYMREHHADVVWHRPKKALLTMVVDRGYPTRVSRWCCQEYKEGGGDGVFKVVGIRAAESPRRAKMWKTLMRWDAKRHGGTADSWVLSPCFAWSDADVWEFIRAEGMAYCSLYDEGLKRLGCIGCPMARERGRRKEFARWPGYERGWRRAFRRLWANRLATNPIITRGKHKGEPWPGLHGIDTPDKLFEWWLSDAGAPDDESDCFLGFFGGEEDA